MSPFLLMFAKLVLSSLSSLEVYYGTVPRTQLPNGRNPWKSTTASAAGCRNLLSFLSICAQSEPVKCWRNNSYKLLWNTSFSSFHPPICSFLVLLFFWWWQRPPIFILWFSSPSGSQWKVQMVFDVNQSKILLGSPCPPFHALGISIIKKAMIVI